MSRSLPAPVPDRSLALRDVALSRRSALYLVTGTAAALALAPGLVFARRAFAADEPGRYEPFAESWRYSGGSALADPETDAANTAGLSTLAVTSSSSYSTWTAENGASSYLIQTDAVEEDEETGEATETSTAETVEVEGVARVGIDVSRWQYDVDWASVAEQGIGFAIIRCGWGDDDEDQDDPCFLQNIQGALDAGLDVGLYLYSYATTSTGAGGSAQSEAAHVLRLLEEAGLGPDDLDLPVFLDMEDTSQAALDAAELGDIARVFCNLIADAGFKVGIYANKYWWTNYLTDEAFSTDKWYRWAARYPTTAESNSSEVDDASLWQFTCNGEVDGVEVAVDVDFDYVGRGGYEVAEVDEELVAKLEELSSATPTLAWRAHLQTYGWTTGSQTMPATATLGTTGLSKRIEAIELSLADTTLSGSIAYRAHCQTYGWQDWMYDGEMAGTSGLSKRIEALQIKLTDELAEAFDVYYRLHCQTYGWLDWASNGQEAGTMGYSKRAEAIEVCFVRKGEDAPGDTTTPYVDTATLSVQAHMQTYGWLDAVAAGATAGKTGSGKRLEALRISMSSQVEGSIVYRAYRQTYGWTDWVSDGETAGSVGASKRLEALQVKLTGEAAEHYTVWYRSYVQDHGWLGWATAGATSGTTGLSKRIEGVQVKILAKSASAPGSTANAALS